MNKASLATNPNLSSIEYDHATGMELKAIAEKYDVSRSVLSRWFRRSPGKTNRESLESQIAKWKTRADTLWAQAELDADSRAMAQSIAAGFRSVELQVKHLAEQEEAAKGPPEQQFFRLEDIDAKVASMAQQAERDSYQRALDCAAGLGELSAFALFERMLSDENLKVAIYQFVLDWEKANDRQQTAVAN
jgi:hypothetical protein